MRPALEVQDLSYAYQRGHPILHGVSFTVEPGERVGLIGGNGAGKSTLLWSILGLHRAAGQVRILGQERRRTVLDRVGVVFQNPEDLLFMPALLDDLTLPLLNRGIAREEAVARARRALDRMGLADYESEPAAHLSLGQRKRAAIAAALVTEPELLILDEPTAELDGRSVRQLAAYLLELPVTCLLSGHDLPFLTRVTTRLILLDRGAIAADGPTDRVTAKADLLEQAGVI